MRLIDADRAASIENLDQYSDLAAALGDVQTVRDILSDAPTIDAVPVVRCQDCRYYQDAKVNEKGFLICPASGMEITETDYCSYGSRMDKEDEHEIG